MIPALMTGILFFFQKNIGIGVLKLECDHDEQVSKDLICEMKPLQNGSANLTLGVTLLEETNTIKVITLSMKKRT
jgi:hypothetical protein